MKPPVSRYNVTLSTKVSAFMLQSIPVLTTNLTDYVAKPVFSIIINRILTWRHLKIHKYTCNSLLILMIKSGYKL